MRETVARGDARLAMRYFEKMGFAKEREIGPTSVEEVREQRELAKRKKKMEQRKLRRELGTDETGVPPWE